MIKAHEAHQFNTAGLSFTLERYVEGSENTYPSTYIELRLGDRELDYYQIQELRLMIDVFNDWNEDAEWPEIRRIGGLKVV